MAQRRAEKPKKVKISQKQQEVYRRPDCPQDKDLRRTP